MAQKKDSIRNVAIIAHVDHGKTTLVDQMFRQSGLFREGELGDDLILDSNPQEKERGITILSKNCALEFTNEAGELYHINILDTPGHADFGGEVERVLRMADGVLLLVDAFEGPMPQTRYVLAKALENHLQPIIVVNKVDKPESRPEEVVDEVLGLMIDLGADEDLLDCPVCYASGRDGWATRDMDVAMNGGTDNIMPVFDMIIEHVPAPDLDSEAPLQMLITTLDYNDYVGRIGVGRVFAGTLKSGSSVMRIDRDGKQTRQRIQKLHQFEGLGRREVQEIVAGDICAVIGLDEVDIGDTLADPENPVALPPVHVDEPTLHMNMRVNDGPFVGQEGKYVTSRQVRERLERELRSNVAMKMNPSESGEEFIVSGRGMLHLGILLENMRREGYEITVGKPEVIYKEIDGIKHEPIEMLVIETPNDTVSSCMMLLGDRRAELIKMDERGTYTHMSFFIPSRALIGLRNKMLTATQGKAIMHHVFERYEPFKGQVAQREKGVMIATETGEATTYALEQFADRGVMFIKPQTKVYEGMIVGEHCKDNDIVVNISRKRQVNNIRSANKEIDVKLKGTRDMTLEMALEYVEEDELVEITPENVRLRKRQLKESERRRLARIAKTAAKAAAAAG